MVKKADWHNLLTRVNYLENKVFQLPKEPEEPKTMTTIDFWIAVIGTAVLVGLVTAAITVHNMTKYQIDYVFQPDGSVSVCGSKDGNVLFSNNMRYGFKTITNHVSKSRFENTFQSVRVGDVNESR